MTDRHDMPDMIRGAIAGVLAGLAASYVMNAFQAGASKIGGDPGDGGDEPSTDKAANAVVTTVTGQGLPKDARAAGGQLVHYALGAALGLGYGVAAELRPTVTRGFGTGFGLAAAGLLDEAAVPLLGLSRPPSATPPSGHAYSLISHLLFGAALEGSRRLIRVLT